MIRRLIGLSIVTMVLISSAQALDLSATVTDLDGKPITVPEGKKPTVAFYAETVLTANFTDETNIEQTKPGEKFRRYVLAKKIHDSPASVDLSVEEVALIRALAAKGLGVVEAGRIQEYLASATGTAAKAP